MSSAFRRNFLILWSDLLIALSAFWLARYFGDMPRWSAGAFGGCLGGAGRSVAQVAVRCIQEDTLCVSGNLRAGRTFGAVPLHPVPALRARLRIRLFIILATGIIIVLEWALYCAVRRLVYRNPFLRRASAGRCDGSGINTGIEHIGAIENRDDAAAEARARSGEPRSCSAGWWKAVRRFRR